MGQAYDASTGLYYMNARWYDPGVGRFITADPLPGNPFQSGSTNRYAYALNNPITYQDTSGLTARLVGNINNVASTYGVVAAMLGGGWFLSNLPAHGQPATSLPGFANIMLSVLGTAVGLAGAFLAAWAMAIQNLPPFWAYFLTLIVAIAFLALAAWAISTIYEVFAALPLAMAWEQFLMTGGQFLLGTAVFAGLVGIGLLASIGMSAGQSYAANNSSG